MNAELNRKMAEEVMGWHIEKVGGGYPGYWCEPEISDGLMRKTKSVMMDQNWNPSENTDQALMALLEMENIGRIDDIEIRHDDNKWIIWFTCYDDFFDDYPMQGIAESLAEAICLAVLEANQKIKETK